MWDALNNARTSDHECSGRGGAWDYRERAER